MRLLISSIILFFLIVVLALIVVVSPYYYYQKTITKGAHSSYLEVNRVRKEFISASKYVLEKRDAVFSDEEEWRGIHLYNLLTVLPLKHSYYQVIPIIDKKYGDIQFSIKYMDQQDNFLGHFEFSQSFRFNRASLDEKIFRLPIFKRYITRIPEKKIWRDLFGKNLNLPNSKSGGPLSYFKENNWKISYKELVYNLFLLKMRVEMFPESLVFSQFYEDKFLGVIEYKPETEIKDATRYEMVFLLDKGIIHKYKIFTNGERIESENLRRQIISKSSFRKSTQDSAVELYARYNALNLRDKLDQEGVLYLYNAFSHTYKNDEKAKRYLKWMIRSLERKKPESPYIKGFYDYSYDRFGTNFSGIKGRLKESHNEKYKRIKKEELEESFEKARKKKVIVNDKFENNEQKIKFYLKKAKEKEEEINDRILIID